MRLGMRRAMTLIMAVRKHHRDINRAQQSEYKSLYGAGGYFKHQERRLKWDEHGAHTHANEHRDQNMPAHRIAEKTKRQTERLGELTDHVYREHDGRHHPTERITRRAGHMVEIAHDALFFDTDALHGDEYDERQ